LDWRKVLAVFCCVAVVLGALGFAWTHAVQSTVQYDPWLDVDDDGRISGMDITLVCRAFGTAGDPTKTVRVVHSTYNTVFNATVSENVTSYWFNLTGYARVTVAIMINGTATAYICWYWGEPMPPLIDGNFTTINGQDYYIWSSDVRAPLLAIYYYPVNDTLNCETIVAVYATT